jgi:hypothetical protein
MPDSQKSDRRLRLLPAIGPWTSADVRQRSPRCGRWFWVTARCRLPGRYWHLAPAGIQAHTSCWQVSRLGWPAHRPTARAVMRQSGRTFSACGPFCPWVVSNSTFWFSFSDR